MCHFSGCVQVGVSHWFWCCCRIFRCNRMNRMEQVCFKWNKKIEFNNSLVSNAFVLKGGLLKADTLSIKWCLLESDSFIGKMCWFLISNAFFIEWRLFESNTLSIKWCFLKPYSFCFKWWLFVPDAFLIERTLLISNAFFVKGGLFESDTLSLKRRLFVANSFGIKRWFLVPNAFLVKWWLFESDSY